MRLKRDSECEKYNGINFVQFRLTSFANSSYAQENNKNKSLERSEFSKIFDCFGGAFDNGLCPLNYPGINKKNVINWQAHWN